MREDDFKKERSISLADTISSIDKANYKKMEAIEKLEEYDDVQNVWTDLVE